MPNKRYGAARRLSPPKYITMGASPSESRRLKPPQSGCWVVGCSRQGGVRSSWRWRKKRRDSGQSRPARWYPISIPIFSWWMGFVYWTLPMCMLFAMLLLSLTSLLWERGPEITICRGICQGVRLPECGTTPLRWRKREESRYTHPRGMRKAKKSIRYSICYTEWEEIGRASRRKHVTGVHTCALPICDVASLFNIVAVGEGAGDYYMPGDLPRGTVARMWYNSPSLEKERRITVYTPPGYEESEEEYPVLYLLHGMGGDEEAWITLGRTAQIMRSEERR